MSVPSEGEPVGSTYEYGARAHCADSKVRLLPWVSASRLPMHLLEVAEQLHRVVRLHSRPRVRMWRAIAQRLEERLPALLVVRAQYPARTLEIQ